MPDLRAITLKPQIYFFNIINYYFRINKIKKAPSRLTSGRGHPKNRFQSIKIFVPCWELIFVDTEVSTKFSDQINENY